MRELQALASQVEVIALSIQERIARIHDALSGIHDLTLALDASTPRDPAAVNGWLEASGFGLDEHGYYERPELLARARAGEVDPDVHIYYAMPSITANPEATRRMFAMRGISGALSGVWTRLAGLAWIYYQDATRFSVGYPMHDPCTVVPADFDWHSYHTYRSVHPDVNPERGIRWTPPNIDYGGKGLMVSPSIPLYRHDELYGVWSFDVPVRSLIRESVLPQVVEGQQSFIIDRDGALVAHSMLEAFGPGTSGDIRRKSLEDLGGGYAGLDVPELAESGLASVLDEGGAHRHVVARRVRELGWLVVATVPQQSLVVRMEQSFRDAFDHVRRGDLAHRLGPMGEELQGIVDGYNDMVGEVQSTLERERALALELRQANALKDEFLATVSHELRTPLNAIINVPDLLRQAFVEERVAHCPKCTSSFSFDAGDLASLEAGATRCPECGDTSLSLRSERSFEGDATEHYELLGAVERSAKHLFTLISDLLDTSLLEAGRVRVHPAPVDLSEMLRDFEAEIAQLGYPHQIRFDVPPAPIMVEVDVVRTRQVFLNLVQNATKFSDEHTAIDVFALAEDGGDFVTCVVQDQGDGIPEALQPRMFDVFRQADGSDTRKQGGAGLGLAISKRLVELHGGTIWIESEPGHGTRVKFTLPRVG